MGKFTERIDQLTVIISCLALAGLMILITAGVITRYIFHFSIPSAYEVVEYYLMPITIFAALGYAFKSGIYPRVDTFVEGMKNKKLKRIIDVSILVVEFLVFAFVSYQMFQFTLYSIDTGMGFRSGGTNYPLYPVHLIAFLGFLWMTVHILLRTIKKIKEE